MTGIEWIYIAAVVASTAVGVYSSYQQGKAAEEQAKYNAAVARGNQRQVTEQADRDVTKIRERFRRIRGAQRAAGAKAGISLDGSFNDIMIDTNLTEDMDVLQTLYRGKAMAVSEEGSRRLTLMQGAQASEQARWEMAGTVLSGIGSGIANYPTLQ